MGAISLFRWTGYEHVGFEVLTAVVTKISVFSTLKMEAICYSET
jgi:hypothetical protein